MWRFRSPEDARLVAVLREPARRTGDWGALFARAERHGLAGVLLDAFRGRAIAVPADVERPVATREVAREADYAAHLDMLRAIDAALGSIRAVALKGPLLAGRLYARPSARTSTDIDLLVAPDDIVAAGQALARVGYRPWDHPREDHFRRRGHHLHFLHDAAPPVELHFHAFRGFGGMLSSDPVVARSVAAPGHLGAIRVPSPEDELAYLAVHAAGHRFMKLGWLYDLHLLLARLTPDQVEGAVTIAGASGMSRPVLLALEATRATFGAALPRKARAEGRRFEIARTIADEPRSALARTATRFAYTVSLCDDWTAAKQYMRDAALGRIEELLRPAP
jgi:hypothetical protein